MSLVLFVDRIHGDGNNHRLDAHSPSHKGSGWIHDSVFGGGLTQYDIYTQCHTSNDTIARIETPENVPASGPARAIGFANMGASQDMFVKAHFWIGYMPTAYNISAYIGLVFRAQNINSFYFAGIKKTRLNDGGNTTYDARLFVGKYENGQMVTLWDDQFYYGGTNPTPYYAIQATIKGSNLSVWFSLQGVLSFYSHRNRCVNLTDASISRAGYPGVYYELINRQSGGVFKARYDTIDYHIGSFIAGYPLIAGGKTEYVENFSGSAGAPLHFFESEDFYWITRRTQTNNFVLNGDNTLKVNLSSNYGEVLCYPLIGHNNYRVSCEIKRTTSWNNSSVAGVVVRVNGTATSNTSSAYASTIVGVRQLSGQFYLSLLRADPEGQGGIQSPTVQHEVSIPNFAANTWHTLDVTVDVDENDNLLITAILDNQYTLSYTDTTKRQIAEATSAGIYASNVQYTLFRNFKIALLGLDPCQNIDPTQKPSYDLFMEQAPKSLSSHIADTGEEWELDGTIMGAQGSILEVSSGVFNKGELVTALYDFVQTPNSPDYRIGICHTWGNFHPSYRSGIIGRLTYDTAAYNRFGYAAVFDGETQTIKLYYIQNYKNLIWWLEELGSGGQFGVGENHTLEMKFQGSTITVYLDQSQIISVTDVRAMGKRSALLAFAFERMPDNTFGVSYFFLDASFGETGFVDKNVVLFESMRLNESQSTGKESSVFPVRIYELPSFDDRIHFGRSHDEKGTFLDTLWFYKDLNRTFGIGDSFQGNDLPSIDGKWAVLVETITARDPLFVQASLKDVILADLFKLPDSLSRGIDFTVSDTLNANDITSKLLTILETLFGNDVFDLSTRLVDLPETLTATDVFTLVRVLSIDEVVNAVSSLGRKVTLDELAVIVGAILANTSSPFGESASFGDKVLVTKQGGDENIPPDFVFTVKRPILFTSTGPRRIK